MRWYCWRRESAWGGLGSRSCARTTDHQWRRALPGGKVGHPPAITVLSHESISPPVNSRVLRPGSHWIQSISGQIMRLRRQYSLAHLCYAVLGTVVVLALPLPWQIAVGAIAGLAVPFFFAEVTVLEVAVWVGIGGIVGALQIPAVRSNCGRKAPTAAANVAPVPTIVPDTAVPSRPEGADVRGGSAQRRSSGSAPRQQASGNSHAPLPPASDDP
jgi:hypothetical protein